MDKYLLSFIIPCYGSEETVLSVIDEIIDTVGKEFQYDYEIIAVHDCSPDNVLHVLLESVKQNHKIKVIDLAKNMGKHAALMAGFTYAQGDYIICTDDDGQCPINDTFQLIERLRSGYDAVFAQYKKKKQSIIKNIGSYTNNLMANIILSKPLDLRFSNFFALKKFVIDEMVQYKNPYPYIEGLIVRTTSKIANVYLEERERLVGKSGFTFRKSLSLWLNGFTAFSVKPLRVATIMGFTCAIVGFLLGVYTIIHKLKYPSTPAGYSSIMASLFFVGGMIMLMLGLIGEYIGRIYISINNSPQYVIRQIINFNDQGPYETNNSVLRQ